MKGMRHVINCGFCVSVPHHWLQGTQGNFVILEKGFNKRNSRTWLCSKVCYLFIYF